MLPLLLSLIDSLTMFDGGISKLLHRFSGFENNRLFCSVSIFRSLNLSVVLFTIKL